MFSWRSRNVIRQDIAELRRDFLAAQERMHQENLDERRITREFMRRNELVLRDVLEELKDLRHESRAQRAALLRMLDEWGPAGGGAAPAT